MLNFAARQAHFSCPEHGIERGVHANDADGNGDLAWRGLRGDHEPEQETYAHRSCSRLPRTAAVAN